jgi:hypothetical protein
LISPTKSNQIKSFDTLFPPQSSALSTKASLRRQKLEQCVGIWFYRGENETTDALLTLVLDYDKPLPALPYEKPLPPLPEIEEDFIFESIYRTCGFVDRNDEECVRDFELFIKTEDCEYCLTKEVEDMEGLDIIW